MTEPVLISQYMCGKSEAGLGGTRTGFNYRDPGPLGKQGDTFDVYGVQVAEFTRHYG